jgi:hypothetical protein
VYFTDANTGYAVGNETFNWIIFKTINGGADWDTSATGYWGALNSIYFSDPDTGYAVGNYGLIVKTTDGGTTWTIQEPVTENYLAAVYFPDATSGYVVGIGGTILKTTVGGTVDINENRLDYPHLTIYPNPTQGKCTFETTAKGHLSILNLNGQQLLQQEVTELTTTIDVSTLPSGIYVVKLIGEKEGQVGEFIKQ